MPDTTSYTSDYRTLFDPFGVTKFWKKQSSDAGYSLWHAQTRALIHGWLADGTLDPKGNDGTSYGGRLYRHLKKLAETDMFGMPSLAQPWLKQMMMSSTSWQNAMRSDEMVQRFRAMDAMIREIHPDDHGLLYRPEYNHKFLTEDSTGAIVAVDDDAIVSLFQRPCASAAEGDKLYPHIIMTSSHAQGDSLKDVTGITHGIEALARDCDGQPLPLAQVDKGVKPGQTLILYACDVEETPMLNAAQLMERILELKKVVRSGKPDSEFAHISPGAKRIAKLMLKCMAEDPSRIDVNNPEPMSSLAKDSKNPIRLRADAVEIAHHFQLMGYSKGGNVVSDAMRYLVSELTAKNVEGKDVFETHPDNPAYSLNGRAMSTANVRDIVRSVAVMALASIEVGMSDYYIAHGVRRDAVNNEHDLISVHRNYKSNPPYDNRWLIDGVSEAAGHDPRHMMGLREAEEGFPDIRGYAHGDTRVSRRLHEFYAPNYGLAAIGHVLFNGKAKDGVVTFEAATGTTDAQIAMHVEKMQKAFDMAGLRGAKIENSLENPGIFTLTCGNAYEACDFTKGDNLRKLDTALGMLRKTDDTLMISQTINDEIAAQMAANRGWRR